MIVSIAGVWRTGGKQKYHDYLTLSVSPETNQSKRSAGSSRDSPLRHFDRRWYEMNFDKKREVVGIDCSERFSAASAVSAEVRRKQV